MTTYISNRNSDGKTDENGHFRLPLKVLEGEVLEGFNVSPSSGMVLTISSGEAKIPYSDYSYAVWSDSDATVTVSTASTTGNRIDTIVAYVDRTMEFEETDINHPGALKFASVSGAVSTSPVEPSDATIQSAVGAGNPWIKLANINVPINATSIVSANIDSTVVKKLSISQNVSVPTITASDGTALKFVILNEGDDLPSPEEGVTIVALVQKN